MKKIIIFLAILGAVLIASNAFILYSMNVKFDSMNSRLDQLEVQISRIQGSANKQNNMQGNIAVKQKEVFTPTELAEYLNIEMDRVYDMIDSPSIGLPYISVGGEYRFGKKAIDDWLKGNTGENTDN